MAFFNENFMAMQKELSMIEEKNDGLKNKYYDIPDCVKDLDDLSEFLDLRSDEFNCLKAIWGIAMSRKTNKSRHSGTGIKRDSNKLFHYAKRVKERNE